MQNAFAREMARWLAAPPALRYGMAVTVMAVALIAKYALLIGGLNSGFLLLVPAVLVASVFGGVGPGIVATIIGGLVAYLSVDPVLQLGIANPGDGGRLVLFFADGLLLSALAGALRDTMRQLQDSRAEAEVEHGRTALLQDLTAGLGSESDAATIAAAVIDRSSALVGCDRAWIIVQTTGGLVQLSALHGPSTGSDADEDEDASALARQVVATGAELWIEAGEPEHDRLMTAHRAAFGTSAAVAAVPLTRSDGIVFGALLLGWRTTHAFRPANRELKRAVARITAQALERAELHALQAARIEDLAERETVREAFMAVLSHELRTPVTTIFGASALLARVQTDDDTGLLGDIHAEAERLRRIVDDLLVLSRSERGAIEVSPEPTLLQRSVRDIVDDIGRRYPHADIRFEAAQFLPSAMADPTALVQVVHNLVTNAIKYAGHDGPIEVAVSASGPMAVVTVSDSGPGLGADTDRVFGLFHRAEHTRKRASGTGIGLYVARELVRAMGGDIIGFNREVGGACFRFTLPLAVVEAEDALDALANAG
jgi:two-component system sensor histidine kinase KdpD